MVYSTKKYELVQKIKKLKCTNSNTSSTAAEDGRVTPAPAADKYIRLFLDTGMVDTFFRRPTFSPDGKLLALPCGCYEIPNPEGNSPSQTPGGNAEDKMIQINVVYVFQHLNLEQ